MTFQTATWYDNWNQLGAKHLQDEIVPLGYATRYNMAFGSLVTDPQDGGYTLAMNQPYAEVVRDEIRKQANSVLIYGSFGDGNISQTVADNNANNNRSTRNIVKYLGDNGYQGISIDAEGGGMSSVAELVTQLGPSFKAADLGIAVSAPWPANGPTQLFGANAVQAFNDHVDYVELQDYSSGGTPHDAPVWINAGVNPKILMGGVSTEPGSVQTPLSAVRSWTEYAVKNGLGGMFSWRLDNDHTNPSCGEDCEPTFVGAKTVYYTAHHVQSRGD